MNTYAYKLKTQFRFIKFSIKRFKQSPLLWDCIISGRVVSYRESFEMPFLEYGIYS
jgi:hypothetical protein